MKLVKHVSRCAAQLAFSLPLAGPLGLFLLGRVAAQSPGDGVVYLDQAWSQKDPETYYQISQGSRVMEYSIFVNLEVADSRDGKELSRQKIDHTIPLLMAIDETLDIGIDTRTPIDDSYKLPFRFNGTINIVTYKLGPEQMTAEEREEMQKALARARD